MTKSQFIHLGGIDPIGPAWRTAMFGDCEQLNEKQYLWGKQEFAEMSHAFRPHGGFVSTDEVALKLRCCCEQPIARLARWIFSRSVVCISWDAESLMPAFQFAPDDMTVRPRCAAVLDELRDILDNWEMGLWFAAPNALLDYAAPVAVMEHESLAVLRAARGDRLLAGSKRRSATRSF